MNIKSSVSLGRYKVANKPTPRPNQAVRARLSWLTRISAIAVFTALSTMSIAQTVPAVSVIAPGNNAQVVSPVPFDAEVKSVTGRGITAMKLYLDGNQIRDYSADGLSTTFDAHDTFAAAVGSHTLTVNAWDTSGQLYQTILQFRAANTGIVIHSPAGSSDVGSPVSFSATATSNGAAITAMKLYSNFQPTELADFPGNGSASLNGSGSFQLSNGPATFIVNAWDSDGQLYQSAVQFTVGSTFVPIPSNAVTFKDVQRNQDSSAPDPSIQWSNWSDCAENATCSSGTNAVASQSMQWPVYDPEVDSTPSREFGISWTNTNSQVFPSFLWYTNFRNLSSPATNWVLDYYVQLKSALPQGASLEFDGNQNDVGYFVFGTECNNHANSFNLQEWRFWNGEGWHDSQKPCPLTQGGHWYHVQIHFVRTSSSTYEVHELKVTDTFTGTIVENDNFSGISLSKDNQTDHGAGLDVQEDGNLTGSITVYYDHITVTRW